MNLVTLALPMSRRRISGLVAVALAVLLGTVAVSATLLLAETGVLGHAPTDRFGGASVLVAAPQEVVQKEDIDVALPGRAGVPADLVGRLGALPGVTRVVGDLSFPATPVIDGAAVPVGGHGWSSAALPDAPRLTGRAPAGPAEVAVAGIALAPGASVDIVAGGARGTYRVSAVLDGAPAGLYFTDARAAELSGHPGKVDLVALWSAPGGRTAEDVRAALAGTDLRVVTGAARGDVEYVAAGAGRGTLIALSASLAGVVLMMVGFVVAGALSVNVAGQRRELALMRAVGATPRQVRRLAAAQGTLAALVVLPLGIGGGYLLADRVRDWFVGLGIIPGELALVRGPFPALITAVLFLAVVGIAARGAARKVSALPATEAMAQTATEPPSGVVRARIGYGLILLALTTAAVPLFTRSMVAVAGTGTSGILAAIGLTLAGPQLVRGAGRLLVRRASTGTGRSVTGWIAAHNMRAYAGRNAGALTSLAMAVTFAITYTFTQTTPQHGAALERADSVVGGVTVTAPDLGGVPAYALDRLRALPGARAAVLDATTVVWPDTENGKPKARSHPAAVVGADAEGMVDLGITAGGLGALKGDSIAVGRSFALFNGLAPGDRHELVLADGTRTTATVAAVYSRELGYGDLVVSPDLAYGPRHLVANVLVGGVDAAAVGAALADVPGVRVSAAPPGAAPEVTPSMWLNFVVVGGLLGYVLIGVVNSLVAATSRRREEFGALRFAGATPRQLRAMVRRESLLYGVGACVAGLALSALPVLFLGVGLLGTPVAAGPWWLVPAVGAMVLGTAYAATMVPARRAMRA
ncbi:FtsX-like permease family protein [Longispora sp. NPDC051575]|uniref:ABC transporter permease n=1 Tax=Longispora sp. NPDC051575 TaxID=3154943 RepID=UPI00342F328E